MQTEAGQSTIPCNGFALFCVSSPNPATLSKYMPIQFGLMIQSFTSEPLRAKLLVLLRWVQFVFTSLLFDEMQPQRIQTRVENQCRRESTTKHSTLYIQWPGSMVVAKWSGSRELGTLYKLEDLWMGLFVCLSCYICNCTFQLTPPPSINIVSSSKRKATSIHCKRPA